jgi:hypothetical protein
VSNIGFHAPPNHPGTTEDGTVNNAGYSNAPWDVAQTAGAVTWSSETLAQNANANAVRWGTTYSYRFTSTRPPEVKNATIGFYETGEPITVPIAVPSAACAVLEMSGAVSRKTHGAAGTFDLELPLTGAPGVESRNGPVLGSHTIVLTFNNEVVSGNATVVEGTATVSGPPAFAGKTMTVQLTGVPNVQQVTLALNGVQDGFAQTLPTTTLVMKAIWGDVNGSSAVNAADVGQTKAATGQPLTPVRTSFGADVNVDGAVTASDVGLVKSAAGSAAGLP